VLILPVMALLGAIVCLGAVRTVGPDMQKIAGPEATQD
jgi:hypothetical protein